MNQLQPTCTPERQSARRPLTLELLLVLTVAVCGFLGSLANARNSAMSELVDLAECCGGGLSVKPEAEAESEP
jgi:hypothetical protein